MLKLIPFNLNPTAELLRNYKIYSVKNSYRIKFQLNLLHTIKIVYKTSPPAAWFLLRQQNRTMPCKNLVTYFLPRKYGALYVL